MRNGLRVGRIAGIDIHLDWSLLIIFSLVTLSLGGGLFPAWHPDWGSGVRWGTALAAAVLFFASVLVHELSHALVGRAQGMEINRITLFIFGGMAHLEREPHRWRAELWMAGVGPLTSLVLGVLFLILADLAAGPVPIDPENPAPGLAQLSPLATLLLWLGPVNIVLGVFNLVPAFPLDGGRVLRALLWGRSGDLRTATRHASRIGQGFAWLLMAAGVAMVLGLRVPFFGSGLVNGVWITFIGWFLNNAAMMSYRQLLVRETLDDVPVARVMRRDFVSLPPEVPLAAVVDDYFLTTDQRGFPVVEGGRLLGMLCLEDVKRVPREQWATTPARAVMTPLDRITQLSPGEDAAEALHALTRRAVNQLPVVEDGQVRGFVRREDILRLLSLYGDPRLTG